MSTRQYQSFVEFWPYYVGEHSDPKCRALHFMGTSLAFFSLLTAVVLAQWWLLLAVPIVGYGPAWIGHFFIEKNKPATFEYPFWSLIADFKMLCLMLGGKMGAEVERATAAPPK